MKRKFKKDCVLTRLRRIEWKCDRILDRLAAGRRSDETIDSLIGKMHRAAGELQRMAGTDLRNP